MALTCPSYTYPTVLNGQVYTAGSTNETVIFECLSGFYMTGTKRLDCTGGLWPTTVPTCDIIKQYDDDDIFPSWWFYVLAAILGLLVLACFLCICCWWCCRPHNSVQPYDRYSDGRCGCGNGCCSTGCGGCCGTRCGLCCMGSRCCPCCKGKGNNVSDADERRYHNVHTRSPVDNGGVYFIPANTGRPPENGSGGPNGFYVYQTKDLPKVHVKDQSTNTTDNKRKPINEPHQETETSPNNGANATYLSTYATSSGNAKPNSQLGNSNSQVAKSNGPVAKSNGYVANPNGYVAHPATDEDDDDVARGTAPYDTKNKNNREPNAWANNKTPRESQPHASNGPYRDSKAWKDNSNSETRSDGDMMDNAAKSKKPAREVKAWLPHSHGIRNINTSTK